ncbi:MAG: hypothetical protein O7H41_15915 [Planctomycetota bacterium]|nr:hypothetical protein [Planctomycetota bacterium]
MVMIIFMAMIAAGGRGFESLPMMIGIMLAMINAIIARRGKIVRWGASWLAWVLTYLANSRPKSHVKDRALQDPRLTIHIEGDQELVAHFDAGDLWEIATEVCAARRPPGPRSLSEPERRRLALAGTRTRIGLGGTPPGPSGHHSWRGGTSRSCG